MGSHRRVFSQGNVPFSWEEKPGVSKFCSHHKNPSSPDVKTDFLNLGKPLPPPPPPSGAPTPGRRNSSSSLRGLIRDDPFMVAFVECTKNRTVEKKSKILQNNNGDDHHQRKSCTINGLSKKGGKFFFLCKNALEDVEVDNFLRYSNLPPLPHHKDSIPRGRIYIKH